MELLEVYYTSLVIGGVDAEGLTVTFKFTTSMIDDILEDVPVIDTNRYIWCKNKNVFSPFGGKGNVMKLDKQITNEELLELTKKAFDNNEVAEFLCGEKGYACPISHFVPANVPTDFSRIIDFGVYKLYEETKNEKIVAKFEEAILYLLDCDPAKNWIAFMVCWNQIRNEKRHEAPFKFINQELIEQLKETLLKHEKELRVCKEWQGWNEENGLWQEITRINNIATKNYGVSILWI